MQITRQKIIDYLASNHQVSAVELSQLLGQTPANIRHHLNILVIENKIEFVGETSGSGRGRPTKHYMRTPQAQPHGLDTLLSSLLWEIQNSRTEKQRQNNLKKLGERLAAIEIKLPSPITTRLSALIQRLNDLLYQAHWEAHADGPQVILGQCPYAEVIDQHPELCQMDKYLLEASLNTPMVQTEKFSRNPNGPPHCVFEPAKQGKI
ncbi:MAG: ArsR family transcriptional regulator [Chloroflexota bacterium]